MQSAAAPTERGNDIASTVVATMSQMGVIGLPRNYEIFYEALTGTNAALSLEVIALGNRPTQEQLDLIGQKFFAQNHGQGIVEHAREILARELEGVANLLRNEQTHLERYARKASSIAWSALRRGIAMRVVAVLQVLGRDARAPPVHSVTFLPVISTWMPPACVPSARWTAKKLCTSSGCGRTDASCSRQRDRVAVHRIARPDDLAAFRSTARTSFGRCSSDLVGAEAGDQRQAARLVVRVEEVDQLDQAVGVSDGPHFRPSGFFMPRQYSTCAWSAGACGRRSRSCGPRWRTSRPRSNRRGSAPARSRAAAPHGWCRSRSRAAAIVGLRADAAGLHEVHRLGDPVGELR
jgi:hypothetical protein